MKTRKSENWDKIGMHVCLNLIYNILSGSKSSVDRFGVYVKS